MEVEVIQKFTVADAGEAEENKLVLGRYKESPRVLRLEMTSSSKGGGVFENRFTNDFLTAFNEALDLVLEEKQKEGEGALVLTSSGKIWSNGLHIECLMKPDRMEYVHRYLSLLHRMLEFPMPVVAACQGHTFAGGMLFALTCNRRVASSDKGFWCMPEIDLGFPLTSGMNALIKDKIRDPQFQARMMLEGSRLKAKELLEEGVVETIAPSAEVERKAFEIAERLAKKSGSPAYGQLKSMLSLNSIETMAKEIGINKAKL